MSGLIIKLSPSERILINGAVIKNGDRSSRITILTPSANLLRLKDAIHPEEVKTPVSRICYIAQMVLSGDETAQAGHEAILKALNDLQGVFSDHFSLTTLHKAIAEFRADRTYPGLKLLRQLLPIEARLLKGDRK